MLHATVCRQKINLETVYMCGDHSHASCGLITAASITLQIALKLSQQGVNGPICYSMQCFTISLDEHRCVRCDAQWLLLPIVLFCSPHWCSVSILEY